LKLFLTCLFPRFSIERIFKVFVFGFFFCFSLQRHFTVCFKDCIDCLLGFFYMKVNKLPLSLLTSFSFSLWEFFWFFFVSWNFFFFLLFFFKGFSFLLVLFLKSISCFFSFFPSIFHFFFPLFSFTLVSFLGAF